MVDYTRNDLLLGSQDPFFWFLVPLFGLLCVGICVAVNYVAIAVTHTFAVLYSFFYSASLRVDDGRQVVSLVRCCLG
jgi:hypothetical protein